jgi:hypothetical protein
MKYPNLFTLPLLLTVVCTVSCQQHATERSLSQQSQTLARQDLKEAKYSDDAIRNRAVSQDEWQDFKIQAENKLDDIEIQLALVDRSAMPPDNGFTVLFLKQLDSLENHNAMMKSSIAVYNERQSEWAAFMHAFEKDIASTDMALQAFLPK